MKRIVIIVSLVFSLSSFAHGQVFDHSLWDNLLKKEVKSQDGGRVTGVNYGGMAEHRPQLRTYLDKLSAVDEELFNTWEKAHRLAFLINAYNAWTVELILTKYPDLESIKELGSLFRSPWKKKFIPLLGRTLSLDDIEHGLIRAPGVYDDPRIHFAVNCASIGCPALKSEAYQGDILETQLQEAERLFLSDSTRNRFRDGVFEISSIFKWYKEDFEKGYLGIATLQDYLLSHAEFFGIGTEQKTGLDENFPEIKYLKYDWKLNDARAFRLKTP